MHSDPICVVKFGSSVLASDQRVTLAVHEIYRHLRQGSRVVAVTSAVGRTTDQLVERARQVGGLGDATAIASLLSTGEAAAAALLALALDRAGIPARLVDPREIGLRATGPLLDGEPDGLDRERLAEHLARRPVVVVPGFFAQGDPGGLALFGRGGSDFTALYLAHHLEARCVLVKDVDGLFERDPAAFPSGFCERYRALGWDDAVRRIDRAVQPKALRFASRCRVAFEVAALGGTGGTRVGPFPTRLETTAAPARPLRVALLGLGHVGLGVAQHLVALPERFALTAIAVRDPRLHFRDGVPPTLLTADPWEAIESECDVVVEALGGREPAADLIAAALGSGRDVVTANKQVVAESGLSLARLAAQQGGELRFSAAVGGAVPMLERIELAARSGVVVGLAGVLNGTTSFILDRLAAGESQEEAVAEAQRHGLAEADPRCDLDGRDVRWKLQLLARAAFGVELDGESVQCDGIERVNSEMLEAAARSGGRVRLLARCRRPVGASGERQLEATIGPEIVPADSMLGATCDVENRLEVELAGGGSFQLTGKGAGRWPTAEAVLADLLDLAALDRRSEVAAPSLREAAQ